MIAPHAGNIPVGQHGDALVGLGAVAHHIAKADNSADPPGVDVGQHGRQCVAVGVNVG